MHALSLRIGRARRTKPMRWISAATAPPETRGDIAYLGQLEDDMADFVGRDPQDQSDRAADAARSFLRRRLCAARRRLADPEPVRAHRAAGALSRLRRPDQPAESGGWANADIPRFLALSVCAGSGCHAAESLPALAFAVPPNSSQILTATYSYRLMRNFAASDYRADLAAATKPMTIFSGSADELMDSAKYVEAVGIARPSGSSRASITWVSSVIPPRYRPSPTTSRPQV